MHIREYRWPDEVPFFAKFSEATPPLTMRAPSVLAWSIAFEMFLNSSVPQPDPSSVVQRVAYHHLLASRRKHVKEPVVPYTSWTKCSSWKYTIARHTQSLVRAASSAAVRSASAMMMSAFSPNSNCVRVRFWAAC